MNKYETLSLIKHSRRGINTDKPRLINCGNSVLSFVILHLREEVVAVPPDLQPYLNDLILYGKDPDEWLAAQVSTENKDEKSPA